MTPECRRKRYDEKLTNSEWASVLGAEGWWLLLMRKIRKWKNDVRNHAIMLDDELDRLYFCAISETSRSFIASFCVSWYCVASRIVSTMSRRLCRALRDSENWNYYVYIFMVLFIRNLNVSYTSVVCCMFNFILISRYCYRICVTVVLACFQFPAALFAWFFVRRSANGSEMRHKQDTIKFSAQCHQHENTIKKRFQSKLPELHLSSKHRKELVKLLINFFQVSMGRHWHAEKSIIFPGLCCFFSAKTEIPKITKLDPRKNYFEVSSKDVEVLFSQ